VSELARLRHDARRARDASQFIAQPVDHSGNGTDSDARLSKKHAGRPSHLP
jgi:hypothetical protein